ncbi:MAG: protein kinase [Polyangiaceae bacterium]
MAEEPRKSIDALAETALGSMQEAQSDVEPRPVSATDPMGATIAQSAPRRPSSTIDPNSTEALLAESDSLAATSTDPTTSPPSGERAGTSSGQSASGSRPSKSQPATSDRHPSLLEAPSPDAIPGARADADTLEPFGPFSRVELLAAQGAMGLVARGYNEAFDRWELLKFLRPELANEAELLRQFQREGRVLARLSHPNVVQVFATYQVNGQPCLAMEFLAGESLGGLIEKNPQGIPINQWYELFVEAARGMAAAHDLGLLHRDIKPDNLFVIPERKGSTRGLKLIDFGLATADRSKIDLQSSDRSLLAQTRGGTPLYMAPELWRGEDASPRTDIFAMGMTFYNAATGGFPFQISTMPMVVMTMSSPEPFASVREARRELPPAFASIVDRALAKRKEERFASADELVAALVAAASAARPRKVPGSGPYRGLERFSAAERDVFFGRDEEIAEVLERLRNQPGVLLVGPSGAGKSSLAHAGVVPAVEEGALGGGLVFKSAAIEPRAHPCASLAAGLAHGTGVPEKDLLTFLRTTPEKTGESLRQALPQATGLVLIVDQLEELATIATDSKEIRDFCVAIASMFEVLSPQLRVLATVRADLMDRLFALEPLRAFLTRGFYPVRPMGEAALRRALEEPAKAAGFTLEDPKIAEAIVADVSRTSAGLPLMSFAMASWWKSRDEARKILPTSAWQSLGGLGGALAKHGDSVLESMSTEERASAAVILPRLVSPEGTRARASRTMLVDPAAAGQGAARALELLLQSKLLLESGGEVELAHEALISRWPRLRTMLDIAGDDRVFRERVASAARDWDMQGRPDGALWTDAQAARLLVWFTKTQAALSQQELAFVEAVRRAGAWRKLLGRSLVASGLLVAITLALLASRSERKLATSLDEARHQATETEKKFKHAESERLRMNAQLLLRQDPAAALRTVLQGHSLVADPSTDPIAWEARALGVASPLPLHAGGAGAVRISPSSTWIATSGADGTIHLLSTTSSEHTIIRPGKNGSIPRSIAFAPEGEKLASGGTGGDLAIAETPRFSPVVLANLEGPIQGLTWLNANTLLLRYEPVAASTAESIIATYDTIARKLSPVYKGAISAWTRPHDQTTVIVVSPDGVLHSIDALSGKSTDTKIETLGTATSHIAKVTAIALSNDGSTVVMGDAHGALVTAALKDGKASQARALSPHEGAITVLTFGPDNVLLSVADRGPARLWDAALEHPVSLDDALPAMTWISSRQALALAAANGELLLVSLTSRTVVARLAGTTSTISSLAVSKDGAWLLAASLDGATRAYSMDEALPRVMRIEAPTPTAPKNGAASPSTPPATSASSVKAAATAGSSSARTATLSAPESPACVVSVDGTTAGCIEGDSLRIEPIEGSSVRDLKPRRVKLGGSISQLALGPKGSPAVWANRGGVAHVEQASVGPVLTSPVVAVSTTKGHAAIAGIADGKPVLLATLANGTTPTLPTPSGKVLALAFSHDDASLFVATDDGAITEIELTSGEAHPASRPTLLGKAHIAALAAADDGSSLAIADSTGRVIVLPVVASKKAKERVLTTYAPPIACLVYSQGARALIVAGRSQPISVMDLDSRGHFEAVDPVAPITSCARSSIDDRVSFVTAERTVWLRSLDLSPATMSRPPEDALDPRTMPVELWAGLPKKAQ